MGFGKKDAEGEKKVRDEKEEKEKDKKKDEIDLTTAPITAATVSGFTIGM